VSGIVGQGNHWAVRPPRPFTEPDIVFITYAGQVVGYETMLPVTWMNTSGAQRSYRFSYRNESALPHVWHPVQIQEEVLAPNGEFRITMYYELFPSQCAKSGSQRGHSASTSASEHLISQWRAASLIAFVFAASLCLLSCFPFLHPQKGPACYITVVVIPGGLLLALVPGISAMTSCARLVDEVVAPHQLCAHFGLVGAYTLGLGMAPSSCGLLASACGCALAWSRRSRQSPDFDTNAIQRPVILGSSTAEAAFEKGGIKKDIEHAVVCTTLQRKDQGETMVSV